MKNKHVIHAVMDDGVPMMFETLEKIGIDTSKCFICGTEIVPTEREPRYLSETLSRWWARIKGRDKKFYDWNIGAFYSRGIVCDETQCFVKLLDISRAERLLKQLMEERGKSQEDAITWMKELGYDVSLLEEA